MPTYTIKDKSRSLSVVGHKLSASSSYESGKTRWITFELYKSDSGAYVLHRVGRSVVYHSSDCLNTIKNGLSPVLAEELADTWVSCRLCQPDNESQYIFPETDRHFVMTCGHAQGVLEFLSRYDQRTGSSYYTDVSLDLIEDAAEVDADINFAYYGKDSVID